MFLDLPLSRIMKTMAEMRLAMMATKARPIMMRMTSIVNMRRPQLGKVLASNLIPFVAAIALIALTLSLGRWQLERAAQKAALLEAQTQALAQPPINGNLQTLASTDWGRRRVRLQGEWLNSKTIFLDNRTYKGQAGFFVLTPLRLNGSSVASADPIIVLRGWVARDPAQRTRLPTLSSTSSAEVTGIAESFDVHRSRLIPSTQTDPRGARMREGDGGRIWQSLDALEASVWVGMPLAPFVLRQLNTQTAPDGLARDLQRDLQRDWSAGLDGLTNAINKHKGYAFQWFAMAVALTLLSLYYLILRPRKRKVTG
jgi:surfeit locus 1 family protein